MFRIKFQTVSLIFSIIVFQSCCTAAGNSSGPFFSQKWGLDFRLRPTETGDTLSIGAVFSNAAELFINDQAAGKVVVMDKTGKITSKIPLEPIGRGTYSGDDFIVRDSQFVFINTVDKRVEYFARATGKHLQSLPLPTRVLAAQTKRSDRIIDRIFLVDKTVLIGNGTLLFDLETGLKKTAATVTVLRAPVTARYTLLTEKKRFMTTGRFIADSSTGEKTAIPASHYAISGKRFFLLNECLYSIAAEQDGIRIVDCGLKKGKPSQR